MKEENKVKFYLFALGNSVVKVENGARWYRRDRQNHKWEASNSWLARFYDPAYDVVEIEYDERQKRSCLNGLVFDLLDNEKAVYMFSARVGSAYPCAFD